MTLEELRAAWKDLNYVFRSPRIESEDLAAQIDRDMFHLRRKITYWKGHQDLPVQLHPVEGMSAGAIIDLMVKEGGIERSRILSELADGSARLGEKRHHVREVFERPSRSEGNVSSGSGQADSDVSDRWTRHELAVVVRSYLEKLRFEERGIRFSVVGHVSDLQTKSNGRRSSNDVKYALQTVSAVLAQQSLRWLSVYKPVGQLPASMAQDIVELLAESAAEFGAPIRTQDEAMAASSTKSPLATSPDLSGVPAGNPTPEATVAERREFARDPAVRAWVLEIANGTCEACGSEAPFRDDAGAPFLEVHHVVPLADNGPDIVQNAAAVCPNCHRRFHHSSDRLAFIQALYGRVARLNRA